MFLNVMLDLSLLFWESSWQKVAQESYHQNVLYKITKIENSKDVAFFNFHICYVLTHYWVQKEVTGYFSCNFLLKLISKCFYTKGCVTYQFLYAMHHNDVKTWPPSTPTRCVIFKFSTKTIVFQKMFQVSLTAKKVDYIFEEIYNFSWQHKI